MRWSDSVEKFKQDIHIKSYECDAKGQLRLRSLFNFFQDIADKHASHIGVGYEYCLKNNVGWISGGYHIQIKKVPLWNMKICLTTWPSKAQGATAFREFLLTDTQTGDVLIQASSQWVLLDAVRQRPTSVLPHLAHCEPILERCVDTSFPKLPVLDRIDYQQNEIIRTDDIDLNQHVNNAVYPALIYDALPVAFKENHMLSEIQIQYKNPAHFGEKIVVQTQLNDKNGLHLITNDSQTIEYVRLCTHWQ